MSDLSPLDQVVFISLPDTFHQTVGTMQIDPTRMLPVDTGGDSETWNIDELTWEMILSGMLKVLAHQPDHDDADYYRQFVENARPEIVNELSETGVIQARNRNFEIAEEVFLALSGLKPDMIQPKVNLALVYEQRAEEKERIGENESAAEFVDLAYAIYRKVLSADEVPIDAHLNAGLFFFKQRDFGRARDQLDYFAQNTAEEDKAERARKIVTEIDDQNLLDQLFKEAYDFIRLGQERNGIERVKEFIKKNAQVWNAWFLLGWGHRRLGEFDQARTAFERALQLGGDTVDTRNELALCLIEAGQFKDARQHLESALKREPENTKIISNLGVLELKRGNRDQAGRFFRTVLEVQPDDPVAKQYLNQLDETE